MSAPQYSYREAQELIRFRRERERKSLSAISAELIRRGFATRSGRGVWGVGQVWKEEQRWKAKE